MLPVALFLVGLGYLAGIAGQLRDPVTMLLLALAGGGALIAAAGTRAAAAGPAAAGFGILALARTLQAVKGTLLANWPFALPAWVAAAGLLLAAAATVAAWRTGRPPAAARVRLGLGVAAAGSAAIAAWLLSIGNLASFVPSLSVTAGLVLAAAAGGRAAAPVHTGPVTP